MLQPSVALLTAFGIVFSPVVGRFLVQKPGLVVPPIHRSNLTAVEKIFDSSYEAYKRHAFGHDSFRPISNGFADGRNGWGATIFDSMSTMKVMGKDELFEEAVQFVALTDFNTSKTSDPVSVFETTIRYLGGLLSAYELTDGKYSVLLDKAREVADKMAFAWVGDNDIPYGYMDFATNTPSSLDTSNIAEAGTLTLEWGTLSKYTNNDTYGSLAERAVRRIISQPAPLPGLPAQGINPASGTSVGGYVTWGGGSDSYFEYLIKHARLSNTPDTIFADTWRTAVDSSINNLLKTSVSGAHAYLADLDDERRIRHVGSHLACFHGGNWLYGGKMLQNDTIVNIGLQLVDACWNTYASTKTGIGPETFAFISQDGTGNDSPNPEQVSFEAEYGFYITRGYYILRPEVLESNFYAWRITADTKYLDRAARAIKSFNKYLSVNGAFSGLVDVNSAKSGRIDDMESFWFAEVLKYLYLTFDDPSHYSLDDYIFNTEAHLFKLSTPRSV